MEISINYFAIIAAAIVHIVLGFAWYSSFLFGNPWKRVVGIDPDVKPDKKAMYRGLAIGVVSSLIIAYVLTHSLYVAGVETIAEAVMVGFWIWFGFIVPVSAGMVAWEQRAWTLFFINTGFYLVALLCMAVLLTVWR